MHWNVKLWSKLLPISFLLKFYLLISLQTSGPMRRTPQKKTKKKKKNSSQRWRNSPLATKKLSNRVQVFPPQHPSSSCSCVRYRRFSSIVQGGLTALVACCPPAHRRTHPRGAAGVACLLSTGAWVCLKKAPCVCACVCACVCVGGSIWWMNVAGDAGSQRARGRGGRWWPFGVNYHEPCDSLLSLKSLSGHAHAPQR